MLTGTCAADNATVLYLFPEDCFSFSDLVLGTLIRKAIENMIMTKLEISD